jgi:NOL1/NOP2/fmu family ribosome biogenesis protein
LALRFVVVASIESWISAKGWQRVEIDEEEAGSWNVRGEEVVLVAEAVSAGWNKVTFGRLVDRCGVWYV